MQQGLFTIRSQQQLAASVYCLQLEGDTSAIARPGQFVNLQLPGCFLRRPLSVCDWRENELILIYKTVGAGTELLCQLPAGTRLDVLSGLGNGYDLSKSGASPLLIGGGVGVPPLYGLARRLRQQGVAVQAILGFNTAAEVFYADEFAALGAELTVVTMDGSRGRRGLVTDELAGRQPGYIYCCGPLPMLKAVYEHSQCSGQYSFEERMGCGFGACMGCSCQTKGGPKRICKEGPVLEKEEIIW